MIALYNQGQLEVVVTQANALIEQFPQAIALYNILGTANAGLQRHDAAITNFNHAIGIDPNHAEAYSNLGILLKQKGDLGAAIESYTRAIEIKPDYAEAHSNLGNALLDKGNPTAAISSYNWAISFKPDYVDAHYNLGNALKETGDLTRAIESYNRAIGIKPGYAKTHYNLGNTLLEAGDLTGAIESYNRAIEIKPDHVDAYYNRGIVQQESRDLTSAIESYQRAIEIQPDHSEAHNNLGSALQEKGDLSAAIESYNQALGINPDHAATHSNLGSLLEMDGDLTEAIESFKQALKIKPDLTIARSHKLHQQAHICDWSAIETDRHLIPGLGVSTDFVDPFAILALEDQPARHRQRSELFAQSKCKGRDTALPALARPSKRPERLRIGYFSADFHVHPIMHLVVKMLELHDRFAFEIHAFSLGPNYDDAMRKRLVKSFDTFHDVREMPDQDIAGLARSKDIDIAIDLTGYTRNSRPGILACRPAPVQISYLGYPGTMGADFIDYIIADRTLIPEQSQKFYSEKIVYMPHCYQVSDNSRPTSEVDVSRTELGLPEAGFVFCCFNTNLKITPREFDIWMRLLVGVEGSVLWLQRSNEWAEVNLKKEAETRGVDSGRLIFMDSCTYPEYLMRMAKADLFLDTFNFNAGAIANDALWCGLPVLTLQGQSYVARMASSLLTAFGLPELITTTEDGYEQLALGLATNPEKLNSIKARLNTERDNSALFDTGQFTKDIETAYRWMYDRYFAGENPAHLFV
ncbi:MAG: tetratricopeptide repeat protein, partial [Gammaproteobacteria bacterium]|nr:tetratricopeptide repeat protein [Gammaproteobacteria bacterium]